MDVIKFGFRYWKRNLALSILAKLMSGLALTADLLLPMITALFVDYVIKDSKIQQDNIFSFMLSGKYGAPHTTNLFWHLAILFGTLLLTKLILVYVKNILNQKLGLRMETDMRIATFHKLMTLDSATISQYNTGELLTTLSSDTIMFKDMFCRIIPNIFDSIFVLIVAVILLATINLYLLIIPVIMIPVFLFLYYVYYSDNQPQGRYLMPVLYPLMYFVTLGWNNILTKTVKNEKVRSLICRVLTVLLVISPFACWAFLILP